jgi:hypothetical protein
VAKQQRMTEAEWQSSGIRGILLINKALTLNGQGRREEAGRILGELPGGRKSGGLAERSP